MLPKKLLYTAHHFCNIHVQYCTSTLHGAKIQKKIFFAVTSRVFTTEQYM